MPPSVFRDLLTELQAVWQHMADIRHDYDGVDTESVRERLRQAMRTIEAAKRDVEEMLEG